MSVSSGQDPAQPVELETRSPQPTITNNNVVADDHIRLQGLDTLANDMSSGPIDESVVATQEPPISEPTDFTKVRLAVRRLVLPQSRN